MRMGLPTLGPVGPTAPPPGAVAPPGVVVPGAVAPGVVVLPPGASGRTIGGTMGGTPGAVPPGVSGTVGTTTPGLGEGEGMGACVWCRVQVGVAFMSVRRESKHVKPWHLLTAVSLAIAEAGWTLHHGDLLYP